MELNNGSSIRTLIVGAGMGGLRTAESLRRYKYPGHIHILGDEWHMPYNRPPLSKELLAKDQDLTQVSFPIRSDDLNAEFSLGDGVRQLSIEQRSVTLQTGRKIEFDYLVAATGLRSKKLVFPNNLQSGRFALRSFDNAKAIRQAVGSGKNVVILGSGFIGLEVAATLKGLGCGVKIVAMEDIPLGPILGESFGKEIRRRHEAKGIEFYLENRVTDLVGDDAITHVKLVDGQSLPCDIFIEAIGSSANVEWLEGNELDLTDGLLTDSSLRGVKNNGTSVSNLFAVGDIARYPYMRFDLPPRRIEHWNIPLESSRRTAREIVRQVVPGSIEGFESEDGFNPLPTFWSDQFEFSILSFGEPRLADEIKLLEGNLGEEFIFAYLREDLLVAVAGIGMKGKINEMRKEIIK